MRRIPIGLALLALVGSATACGAHNVAVGPDRQLALRLPSLPTTTTTTTATLPPGPPAVTTVATVIATVAGHSAPNGPVSQTVPATWYGYTSILPVVGRQGDWVEVRLAQRPDQATAWIPASDVKLATTPWYLVLSLSSEHLQVYKDGRLLYSFPAGIGTTDDPTPAGHYFIAMTAPPPSPAYGPFVLATSDHSQTIDNWEGMGDAIVGIHGPIDSYDDQLIGNTGARISHGCVRLHNDQLAELAPVLPGTPLDVTA